MAGGVLFQLLRGLRGIFMPYPGERENIGGPFLSPAPPPFRAFRFFENPECRGAVTPLLSILPTDQIDPSGGGRRLRFFSGIDLSFWSWTLHFILDLSANENTLADVTGSHQDRRSCSDTSAGNI